MKGGCRVGNLSKASPFELGMQILCGVCAKAATQGAVWPSAPPAGRNLPRTGAAEGVPDHRETPAAGPRAHVHRDSSEVSGRFGDWISEREERHSDGPLVWQRAEFHGRALLGRGYAVSTVGFELEQV